MSNPPASCDLALAVLGQASLNLHKHWLKPHKKLDNGFTIAFRAGEAAPR